MRSIVSLVFVLVFSSMGLAQTSSNNGNWTTGANWSGGSVPNGWTTINVGHTMTRSGNYSVQGTINVQASGTLTLTGNITVTGGSTINVYGNLTINGDLTLNSNFVVHPGGKVTVNGTVYVNNSNYLTIGTNVASPPFAEMAITGNLVSQSSGDIRVRRNGRLAIFGNFSSSSSGGTLITLDPGGMVYVGGTTTFTGGGDHLTNNNTTSPYGFYTDGAVTYTGGGAGSNGSAGANSVQNVNTMQGEAGDFFNWVSNLPASPLPVELLHFYLEKSDAEVTLHWATASELNFDRFVIEKTRDGKTFVELGERDGAGISTSRIDYSFTDNQPLLGRSYYRLKAIDFDGYTEYFGVVTVNFEGAEQVIVAPNPAVGNDVKFQLNYSTEGALYCIVLNASGDQVFSSLIQPNGFDSEYTIGKTLTSGLYFLIVQQGQERKMVRFAVY